MEVRLGVIGDDALDTTVFAVRVHGVTDKGETTIGTHVTGVTEGGSEWLEAADGRFRRFVRAGEGGDVSGKGVREYAYTGYLANTFTLLADFLTCRVSGLRGRSRNHEGSSTTWSVGRSC